MTAWPWKISSISRSRFRFLSMMVTCAPMPQCHLGRIVPDNAAAQNHHVARRHARDSAEQDAPAAVGRFQVHRADLHRQPAGHLAHGRQQRQRAVLFANGLVGHGRDLLRAAGRSVRQRRQVQVGEQNQARAADSRIRRLRLFHFDDQVGLVAKPARPKAAAARRPRRNPRSGMELPVPAPASTSTWWPASRSAVTPLGTRPTRVSWSLTSFGTPIIIAVSFVSAAGGRATPAVGAELLALRAQPQANQRQRRRACRRARGSGRCWNFFSARVQSGPQAPRGRALQ